MVTAALLVTAGVLVLGVNVALDTVAATVPSEQPTTLEDELSRILGLSISELDGSGGTTATDTLLNVEQAVREQTLQTVRTLSLLALLLLVPVGLGIGWAVAGRVVRPVGRITEVARDIETTDLSRRIHLEGPPDEMRDLADTFDAMLDRLDQGAQTQRRFVEDASHELRNPLAVIRTTLDVALSDPSDVEGMRRSAEVARRTADRMSTTIDELLAFARTSVQPEQRVPVDLAEVVAEVAQEYDAEASTRRVQLSPLASAGLIVDGDRSALKRAQADLVFPKPRCASLPQARSHPLPRGARRRGGCGSVSATPGLASRRTISPWSSGERGATALPPDGEAHGLGLALVRPRFAEVHGGTVSVARLRAMARVSSCGCRSAATRRRPSGCGPVSGRWPTCCGP